MWYLYNCLIFLKINWPRILCSERTNKSARRHKQSFVIIEWYYNARTFCYNRDFFCYYCEKGKLQVWKFSFCCWTASNSSCVSGRYWEHITRIRNKNDSNQDEFVGEFKKNVKQRKNTEVDISSVGLVNKKLETNEQGETKVVYLRNGEPILQWT